MDPSSSSQDVSFDVAPSGTVALLFTDIVGSTALWEAYPDEMGYARQLHFDLLREAIAMQGGTLFKTMGDGGCASFATTPRAIAAALNFVRSLREATWPTGIEIQVRSAIHTGNVVWEDEDYVGRPVNKVARLVRLAEPGQILLSSASASLADSLPQGSALLSYGSALLKGIGSREELFQLAHPDLVVTPRRFEQDQPHNLESNPFTFVGRGPEMQSIMRKLLDRQERVVTITGMGGIGKSSLARQLAFECLRFFPDGVWFVECDALSSPDELRAAVGTVLHISSATDEEIIAHLQTKNLLMVFDCFERILSCAELVQRWIRKVPQLRILITSRSLLGLPFEYEFALGPMAKDGKASGDALALFADSAAHAIDGFEITPTNRKSVRDICNLLEGVPLALVLAAARLRAMTLGELRDSLHTRRLTLLRRRAIGVDRHADLQVVIAESFGLLEPGDAALLKRLSLFAGGFFREDAVEVLELNSAAESLERLRENSLLTTSAVGGRTRFRLLDTIREFLSDLPDHEDSRRGDAERFSDHYQVIAERIDSGFQEGHWTEAIAQVWLEIANIRAAWEVDDRPESIIQFAQYLARPLFEMGLWEAFEQIYAKAFPAAENFDRPDVQMRLLGLRGALHFRRGNRSAGTADWQARLDLANRLGVEAVACDALLDLAATALESGVWAEARRLALGAIRRARRTHSADISAQGFALLARSAIEQGATTPYRATLRRAERALLDVRDRDTAAFAGVQIARVWHLSGDARTAWQFLMRALAGAAEGERVYGAGRVLLECLNVLPAESEHRIAVATTLRKLAVDRASTLNHQIRQALQTERWLPPSDESWVDCALTLTKVNPFP